MKEANPLTKLARAWLDRTLETESFVAEYFRIRRNLMRTDIEIFSGRFGDLSSNIETALNIYSRQPERSYELDDDQLREAITPVVAQMEKL